MKGFSWIPYYEEFSSKLLKYRHDRKSLLQKIYAHRDELYAKHLHDQDGDDDLLEDIDPFTIFGLFNRQISYENRVQSTTLLKDLFDIKAEVPTDFYGIPVLNNLKSFFFGYREKRKKDDIENLWSLFEKIVKGDDFETEYNTVIKQYGIKINITMGLFWIRPNDFLAFDSTNHQYLKAQYDIDLPKKTTDYQNYISIIDDIKQKMASDIIKEKTFYELSDSASRNSGDSNSDEEETWYDEFVTTWKRRKNIVLFGAPGSGKTYNIPELAVRLCDPDFTDVDNREELMNRYNELKQEKRIAFTTFHQSMDYEDWMEGLRPVVNEYNQITYNIEKGIFAQLCEEAERPIIKDQQTGIANDAIMWKVSLKGTGDNPVRSDCMKNNYIRIGWDGYGPEITDETDWSIHNGEGKQILDAFINKKKEGDIIMSCYSSETIDAIGVVTGDYEYKKHLSEYKRVRNVKWLIKGINENIVAINDGKRMTLSTVYRLNSITLDNVKSILDKYKKPIALESNTQPYVMVIDELNRGNVSKIFGELITLLEPDKRKGSRNAESVILPYSKKTFQIPQNVYIIATMNTADRSLGTLDYAIRRRFAFIANKPYPLEDVNGFDNDLFRQVSELFISNFDEYVDNCYETCLKLEPAETLSEEYRPEDVWIGHSYFLMNDDNGEDCTKDRLLYEIIPLLEEYVRDGVLTTDAEKTIEELREKALQK
ncbi:MAG: AAA family ATPase [Bacteroidales bacterium]|nr:AAA family ATPase [Bacteroidales bacterium]